MTDDGPAHQLAHTTADIGTAIAQANPVTGVLAQLLTVRSARRDRRWKYFVDQLLISWNEELDVLTGALADERVEGLIDHALRASEESQSEETVRLAARIVNEVLTRGESDELLDTAHGLLRLLRSLEPHDLAVLTVLGSDRPGDGPLEGHTVVGGWNLTDLRAKLPNVGELVPIAVAALTANGLTIDHSTRNVGYGGIGRHQLGLTEAGVWLLAHLQALEPKAVGRPASDS